MTVVYVLHDRGQPDIVNEVIAERIISLAKKGERDPDKLCEGALVALSGTPFLSSTFRDFTNGRGSDVDGPIRCAKPDRRTHTQDVPHTPVVPHRADIHQPPLAAALQ